MIVAKTMRGEYYLNVIILILSTIFLSCIAGTSSLQIGTLAIAMLLFNSLIRYKDLYLTADYFSYGTLILFRDSSPIPVDSIAEFKVVQYGDFREVPRIHLTFKDGRKKKISFTLRRGNKEFIKMLSYFKQLGILSTEGRFWKIEEIPDDIDSKDYE